MKDAYSIVDLFKAAYLALVPQGGRSGKQKEIVFESGVPQSTISSIMAGRREGTEEQRRAIATALGFDYESFLDIGRRELGLPAVKKEDPVAPTTAAYLEKAKAIIEAGDKDAENLKLFIDNMHRLHDIMHNKLAGATNVPDNIWTATPEDWEAAKNKK